MTSGQPDYRTGRFSTPLALRREFFDTAVRHAPARPGLRILDIGCGGGEVVRALAQRFPDADVVGIDLAPDSIAAARDASGPDEASSRTRFEVADYLTFSSGPFDLIVSNTVLHLVPGETRALSARLVADLAHGGVLVNCIPMRSASNRALVAVRRVCRLCRGPALDRALLLGARLLHGRSLTVSQLADRIRYMYVVPERYAQDLDESLASLRVTAVARVREPRASLAKLQHVITVYQRI